MSGRHLPWVAFALFWGCGPAPTRLVVHVTASSATIVATLGISVRAVAGGAHVDQSLPANGTRPALPGTVIVVVPDVAASYAVSLSGQDVTGQTLAASTGVTAIPHQDVDVTLSLGPDGTADLAGVDLTGADFASAANDLTSPPSCPGIFCENFESGTINMSVWGVDQINGTATSDGVHSAARGFYSLHSQTNAVASGLTAAGGLLHLRGASLPDQLYGRVFVFTPPLAGDTFNFFYFANSSDNIKVEAAAGRYAIVGYGASAGSFTSAYSVPTNAWTCLELHIDRAAGTVSLSANDSPVLDIQARSWPKPGPLDGFFVGLNNIGTPAADLWLDEVIVDSAPIGCLR